MKTDCLLNVALAIPERGLNARGGGGRSRRVSAAMSRRDTEWRGEFLITPSGCGRCAFRRLQDDLLLAQDPGL
jgi:hypothetical protein